MIEEIEMFIYSINLKKKHVITYVGIKVLYFKDVKGH
jgi:hypothetical protein